MLFRKNASLGRIIKEHTKKSLQTRVNKNIRAHDLASIYPIQTLEETDSEGRLARGPGLGDIAVWMNQDCSVSTGLELSSADPYYASDEYIAAMQRQVASVASELQYEEELQVYWTPWDECREMLGRFAEVRPDYSAFISWWRKARAKREAERFARGEMRVYRSFMFHNISPRQDQLLHDPYGINSNGIHNLWGVANPFLNKISIIPQFFDGMNSEQYEALITHAVRRQNILRSLLSDGNLFNVDAVNARKLFDLLRRSWSPSNWAMDRESKGFYQNHMPAMDSRYAPFGAYFITDKIADGGAFFQVGKYYHTILTHQTLPERCDMGVIPLILKSGNLRDRLSNIEAMMVLKPSDKATEADKLRFKIRMLAGQAKESIDHEDNMKVVEYLQKRLADLRTATRPTMFDCHMQFHLWDTSPDNLEQNVQFVRSALDSRIGYTFDFEEVNAFPYHIQYGQPGFTRVDERDRCIAVVSEEAAVLAPIACNSIGCINPGTDEDAPIPILTETNTGTPYAFDLHAFKRLDNFGGFGLGSPGSGKSNWYQQLIMSCAHREYDVIVLDGADQPSFRPINTLLGGAYFDSKSDIGFNPLSTAIGKDGRPQAPDQEEMGNILITLAAMFTGRRGFTPNEETIVSNAVRYCFENRVHPQGHVYISHLVAGLKPSRFDSPKDAETAGQFQRALTETWINRYGHILNGPDRFSPKWFTVFDVKYLFDPGQEQLCPVIISMIFRYIYRVTNANIGRSLKDKRKILFLCDEAWKALMDPFMVKLLTGLYRTGRARWVSPHLLSQSLEDVQSLIRLTMTNEGDKVSKYESSPIIACSSHIFLFKMSEKDAKMSAELFNLTERQEEQLSTLGGKDGEYKDFVHLMSTKDGRPRTYTCLRSRILPEERWATSTSAHDDGLRVDMIAMLEKEISVSTKAREKLIDELKQAGWPIEKNIQDNVLVHCGAFHRLAHNSNN